MLLAGRLFPRLPLLLLCRSPRLLSPLLGLPLPAVAVVVPILAEVASFLDTMLSCSRLCGGPVFLAMRPSIRFMLRAGDGSHFLGAGRRAGSLAFVSPLSFF